MSRASRGLAGRRSPVAAVDVLAAGLGLRRRGVLAVIGEPVQPVVYGGAWVPVFPGCLPARASGRSNNLGGFTRTSTSRLSGGTFSGVAAIKNNGRTPRCGRLFGCGCPDYRRTGLARLRYSGRRHGWLEPDPPRLSRVDAINVVLRPGQEMFPLAFRFQMWTCHSNDAGRAHCFHVKVRYLIVSRTPWQCVG